MNKKIKYLNDKYVLTFLYVIGKVHLTKVVYDNQSIMQKRPCHKGTQI